MTEKDIWFLHKALEVAGNSRKKGNLPFGCVLVNNKGEVLLEGENTVVTSQDAIAHCEINLVHRLAGKFSVDELGQCTLYASTEPCPMCAAAIFWAGIGRLVYALSKEGYHAIANTTNPDYIFDIKAAALLQHAGRKVIVEGPLLEDETKAIYQQWL